jgi:hypothetical protein
MIGSTMSYRIPDEPVSSGLSTMSVQPFWPLLAIMFGGAWLSWPWFAFNAFATGSPTRVRELALAAGGFAGSAAISLGLIVLAQHGILTTSSARYAVILLTVWKLMVTYLLYVLQNRSFHLYEHFGGGVRNGFPAVLLGGWFGRKIVLTAFASQLWTLVMS